MVASGLTEKVVNDKVGVRALSWSSADLMGTQPVSHSCLCLPQTLSFYFPPCGKIPPPVIMVQNVSFKYSDSTVSGLNAAALTELTSHKPAPLSPTPVFVLVISPPAVHL